MAKSNIDYMVDSYSVIPMIVVGVYSENRGSDFSPPSTELRAHLKQEVFPLIEEKYNVESFKTIVGHSWGGAFMGNTLFSEDYNMFDAYIGISPSFDANGDVILHAADSVLPNRKPMRKYFYASTGNVGIREQEATRDIMMMDSILKKHQNPSLEWKYRIFEGKDHWSSVIPALNDGLVEMSRNYFVDQRMMEDFAKIPNEDLGLQIKNFYKKQEAKFGFTFEPSVGYLNFVGNDFTNMEDYESAVSLYLWALEKNPNHIKVHLNLGDTYDKMKKTKLAKETLEKLLVLMEADKANLSERYYKNVSKWAKEKIESYE